MPARVRATALLPIMVVAVLFVAPTAARATTPSTDASSTWMLSAKVWALEEAGGSMWAGGVFTKYLTPTGASGPTATGLAAFDATGAPASVTIPNLGSTVSVDDLSLGPNGVLYAAGKFSYTFGGASRKNLVGIDPTTGAIVQGFSTPVLRTVLATSDRVYAGGAKLGAYRLDGSKDPSFTDVIPLVDPSLRTHNTPSQFRDLDLHGGVIVAAGQFDFINGSVQKIAVKVDPVTGSPLPWNLAGISANSAAFGLATQIVEDTAFIAAGGSDFVAAYSAVSGEEEWKTDTSGSAQQVVLYDAQTLVVGGHFEWLAASKNQQCGSNQNPNTACFFRPRLAAVDATTGAVDTGWQPNICCNYNGVWGLAVTGTQLHVGGQFTEAGSHTQKYYARFDEAGAPPPSGPVFTDGFEDGDLSAWTSASGLSVGPGSAHSGSFGAADTTSVAWAMARAASPQTDLYARMWLNIAAGNQTVQVMRFRTDTDKNLVTVSVLGNRKLQVKSNTTGATLTSSQTLGTGWHDLQVHGLIDGSSGRIELWLDGTKLIDLTPTSLGSTPFRRIEIGNRTTGKTYDAAYDDVTIDTAFVVDTP
jgi:hypothetical protein